MRKEYTSKYGKIVKECPGVPEYWYKGRMVARGSSITDANPDCPPTKDDWAFCVSLRDDGEKEERA